MNRKLILRLALAGILSLGIVLGILYREHLTQENFESLVARLGIWGPLVYIAIYMVGTVISFPGSVLTLAGGAVFGPFWGSLYVLIGSVSGASLAFLTARYLAAEWVERKATGILRQVKEGVEAEGWRFVAFVRLVPAFPFILVNYVLGLTRIPLVTFAAASAIFMLPGIAGYVYLGYVGREALTGGEGLLNKIGFGLGIFAALVFLPFLVRRLRANRKMTAAGPGSAQTGNDSGPENGARAE